MPDGHIETTILSTMSYAAYRKCKHLIQWNAVKSGRIAPSYSQ